MKSHIEQGHSSHTNNSNGENCFQLPTRTVKPRITHSRRTDQRGRIPALEDSPENVAFNTKNSEILLKLSPYLENITFAGHDSIYQPGEKIDYVYFPQSSIFSEYHILESGATVEIAMTGSEGVIGLASIFDNNPVTNWTQISIAGNALRLKSQLLREETGSNRELQQLLYGYIGSYIKQISQRSVCNSCHSLENRMCSWLLMMQKRFHNPKLPLTQEQMARILGANRPSVTCIAHNLRVAGIIDYRRGSLIILNRTELEHRACGCFAEIDKNFCKIF